MLSSFTSIFDKKDENKKENLSALRRQAFQKNKYHFY